MKERNAEKSRAMILAAAEKEFAEKGFYGARVDEIAASAGINKRMIYAYFGDKEELYKQILRQSYSKMEEVEELLAEQNLTGEALITGIINAYFDFLSDNPSFVSILMWENLNKGRYLREVESTAIERKTIGCFIQSIEEGKKNGVFRKNIDPLQTVLSLITTCFSNFSNQYTLSKLFRTDLTDRENIEIRKKHTAELMKNYICEVQTNA